MATATTTVEHIETIEQSTDQTAPNPLVNLWLGLMTVCLGGTLICTAALVVWPLIATRFVS